MCEFFYLQARDGAIGADALETLVATAQSAAAANPDGTGVFDGQGRVYRTPRTLDDAVARQIVSLFRGSEQVVLHLRQATQGTRDLSNVHPFADDGLLLAHNGHVHGVEEYGGAGDADSKMLLRKITDQSGPVVDRVRDALATTGGWLSIFLLDRDGGDLYYFRDGADMHFARSGDYLVGATKQKRFGGQPTETPPTGVIYRLDADGPSRVGAFDLGGERPAWSGQGGVAGVAGEEWPRYEEPEISDAYRRHRDLAPWHDVEEQWGEG